MASIPKITVPPGVEPVSVAELKSELIIDWSDDDSMIGDKISEARRWAESYLGMKLITQTAVQTFDAFYRLFYLKFAPVLGVTTFEYYYSGSYVTFDSSDYIVDTFGYPGRVQVHPDASTPDTDDVINKVKITYTVGFGAAASDVPEDIKTAIKLRAAALYENRLDMAKRYSEASTHYLINWKNRL